MPLKDMEVHSRVINSVIAKRLWNVLRIAFYMIRRGLISKRKLIMDMNLMMKRGKILRKSLSNLMFHHHHNSSKDQYAAAFQINHYEFSCNNSPNIPVLFHLNNKQRKHHNYFPCIHPPPPHDDPEEVVVVPRIEYSPDYSYSFRFATPDLAPGETLSPMKQSSPFSVRTNYSSEDENDGKNNRQVDDDAEEFIRRFYEQLRTQNRTQLLQ